MYGVRHNVVQDFPEFSSTISHLKERDTAFARLIAQYDEADKRIYGYAQKMCPVADHHLSELKRKRVRLKDKIYAMLQRQLVLE